MSSKLNILISGNPRDGFTHHGPFHTNDMDEATKTWVDCCEADWWVVPLEPINWGQRTDTRTKLWEDAIIAMAALMTSENNQVNEDDRLPWESWNQLFNLDYTLNDLFTGYQYLLNNKTCSQCGQTTHGK